MIYIKSGTKTYQMAGTSLNANGTLHTVTAGSYMKLGGQLYPVGYLGTQYTATFTVTQAPQGAAFVDSGNTAYTLVKPDGSVVNVASGAQTQLFAAGTYTFKTYVQSTDLYIGGVTLSSISSQLTGSLLIGSSTLQSLQDISAPNTKVFNGTEIKVSGSNNAPLGLSSVTQIFLSNISVQTSGLNSLNLTACTNLQNIRVKLADLTYIQLPAAAKYIQLMGCNLSANGIGSLIQSCANNGVRNGLLYIQDQVSGIVPSQGSQAILCTLINDKGWNVKYGTSIDYYRLEFAQNSTYPDADGQYTLDDTTKTGTDRTWTNLSEYVIKYSSTWKIYDASGSLVVDSGLTAEDPYSTAWPTLGKINVYSGLPKATCGG